MPKNVLICNFCNQKIISPKRIFRSPANKFLICEDCIRSCYKACEKDKVYFTSSARRESDIKPDGKPGKKIPPRAIKEELDKYVIGQDDAKIALAIAVYNHYKMLDIHSDVKISKSNILLIGPTGSGKTLLAQTIAGLLDVPFAIADCTSLTEAGYIGDDVESVLWKLISAADGDITRAERGIIFLDEVDKLAKTDIGASLTKDPSGEGVQQALLKLIEGTTANVSEHNRRKLPMEQGLQVNTENILFICGGAFPGLDKIINRRTASSEKCIGFGADVEKKETRPPGETLKNVETEDLVKYGLIPEFIGRLPVIVSLDELDEDAMVDILAKPQNSIVSQYRKLMEYDGIELVFTERALREIARETLKKKTGARGLRSIIEGILRESMYTLPSDEEAEKCIVDGITRDKIHIERQSETMAVC